MAVTDLKVTDPSILDSIDAAYRGGADIIQIRSKVLSDHSLYEIGCQVRNIADRHRKLFFVNDRLDLALAVSADGIHLGQDDLPVACARKLIGASGKHLWIGKSTHSREQAKAALEENVDYFALGPVFQTPTKPGTEPVGVNLLKEVAKMADRPLVAIGGIQLENVRQVLDAGAGRIAVVRAIFQAEEPYEAARKLRNQIEEYCEKLV